MNEQALMKRINRKLAHDQEVVRKARVFTTDLGEYYQVDLVLNAVIGTHVDLESLGAELGVDR